MKLSIVTSLYCSAPTLKEFVDRIVSSSREITNEYEILLVDDGSPDDSLKLALQLTGTDQHLKVIELSRNFGHHPAMMTGLSLAQGEYVFLIDADLEEAPENLSEFWKELRSNPEIDVVYGVQRTRKGNWMEKISGALYYSIFNFVSPIKVPRNLTTCRLMRKEYVQALLEFKEREICISGLWAATGFNQKPIEIEKRSTSQSTYSFRKKIRVFVTAITSFSNKPLIWIFYLGVAISAVAGVEIAVTLYDKIFNKISINGWTSLILSIWLLGGITLFCLGIIGIYLAKIFSETKARPLTIIKSIHPSRERPLREN